jgi:transposase-like protein
LPAGDVPEPFAWAGWARASCGSAILVDQTTEYLSSAGHGGQGDHLTRIVDGVNAGYNERSDDRLNSRNGHRARRWDTRAGTISLDIPKLRQGSYMPSLLEPRRRAEQALVSVICQAYVEGVSTRRVDDLVRSMGIDGMSKSQVSELAKNLDVKVAEFCNRPLDEGPYT